MAKTFSILSIAEGKILNPAAFQRVLLGLKDGKYKVEIAKMDQRSLSVNAYYWMMLTEYVQPALYNAGWREIKTKDDAHLFVTDLF